MILDRYLVRQFSPIFFIATAMFVMLLGLIELFANLWRYLQYEVAAADIFRVSLYYVPKSLSYALPISLLFAAAYTLGDFYGKNELTSIFSSGVPFWRFSISLLVIGFSASCFSFFFDDLVVIPTLRMKNELSRALLHQQRTENNSDIVIKAEGGKLVYSVDFYDFVEEALNGLSIVELDEDGRFVSLIRSPQAFWNGEHWNLSGAVIYEYEGEMLAVRPMTGTERYREEPGAFRRNAVEAEELPVRDAGLLIKDLRGAGLPFTEALADYYHRFSFPAVSLVVMLLSISMGGRFKKNILLMSLLASLVSAVVYYVMEMISMMMAKLGYIPPFAGAWFPVLSFVFIGFLLLRNAKT
ncbi:MAG: LptF/LptG family permease [Treponema sp.]|jgi:lipopolysaccharide export system permease protein|nr:LptF/LptG family permease [Treponema sp.]